MKTRIIAIITAFVVFTVLFSACGSDPLPTGLPSPTQTPTATPAPTQMQTPVPTPGATPTQTPQLPAPKPEPDFPVPFSEVVPSGFDSVFWSKIQELTEECFMGIQYSFLDVDGDGDDELVVNNIGAQFNTLSIFEKIGGEAVSTVRGDRFYMNGQGRLVAHTGHLSDGNSHLYYSGNSQESTLEYQPYSLGSSRVSDEESVYYLIDDRTQSYIDISSYYDGRYNEELIINEWGSGSSTIDISPYLIDEGEYRLLLDELLDGYTEFDIDAHKNYIFIPANYFSLSDKPGKIVIDYADDDFLVFHGNFGLFVYSFELGRITTSFDSNHYFRKGRADYLSVEAEDGSRSVVLQLSPHSGRDPSRVYLLDLLTGLCSIDSYDAQYAVFATQENGSVLFGDGTRGEILCDDSGTIEGLYYTWGDYKRLLFGIK